MQLSAATIAITGATGFLGGFLVTGLKARGARVIAVVRDPQKAARLLGPEIEVRVSDLNDRTHLTRCFEDVDAVISNAAVISFRNPRLTLETNVDGTRNVFEAILSAGVRRAIAISSSAAYPMAWWPRAIDERTPLRTRAWTWFGNAYGVSKAEGERIAWALSRAGGIALTTFRPCGITGPFDPLLLKHIARMMRAPVTPFPAFTEIGVVHAADVTAAVIAALEQPSIAVGKAYNLQGHTATLWQIANAWHEAGGSSPRLRLPIPVPLALRYDDARARRELGWRPRDLTAIVTEAVSAQRLSP